MRAQNACPQDDFRKVRGREGERELISFLLSVIRFDSLRAPRHPELPKMHTGPPPLRSTDDAKIRKFQKHLTLFDRLYRHGTSSVLNFMLLPVGASEFGTPNLLTTRTFTTYTTKFPCNTMIKYKTSTANTAVMNKKTLACITRSSQFTTLCPLDCPVVAACPCPRQMKAYSPPRRPPSAVRSSP